MATGISENTSIFTKYVSPDIIQSLSSTKTILDNRIAQQLSSALLTAGGGNKSKLKVILRRVNLPAGDPERRFLWQKIISARCGRQVLSGVEPGSLDLTTSTYRTHMLDKQLTPTFHLTEAGKPSILRVLHCLGQQNPSLVYAPMLYPLTAMFLHYMTERETLACLEALLGENNMVVQVVEDWKRHCHSLEHLSSRHSKSAHKLLAAESGQWTDSKEDLAYWALVIWKIPFDFLVRIVDCFLFEGSKILYRAGLAIWKETCLRHLKSTSLSSSSSAPDRLRDYLESTAISLATTYTPQRFIVRMFRIRNFGWSSVEHALTIAAGAASVIEMQPLTSPANQYLAFSQYDPNPSGLIDRSELEAILEQLEERISQLQRPVLVFTTERDGTSLTRMVQQIGEYRDTVLLIRSMDNEVFGAYCADSWATHEQRYFGRGTSFVFTLRPQIQFFRWVDQPKNPLANMFQKIGHDHLLVGGGEQGTAIRLDAGLSRGVSNPSTTFQSPALSANQDFSVGAVEVLAFEDVPIG